jgi:hypothetical protein
MSVPVQNRAQSTGYAAEYCTSIELYSTTMRLYFTTDSFGNYFLYTFVPDKKNNDTLILLIKIVDNEDTDTRIQSTSWTQR